MNKEFPETTFRGTFQCTVDQKRRLTVPSRFAKALTPRAKRTVVAVHGLEGCLSFYPLDWWKVFERELLLAEMTNPDLRRGMRRLLMSSEDLQLDSQSRITLSTPLLDHAGIRSNCVLTGVGDRMELWSPDGLERYLHMEGTPSFETTMIGFGQFMTKTSLIVRDQRDELAANDSEE